jgi:25S rRNA (uracil2634-N3)-methyltransferase
MFLSWFNVLSYGARIVFARKGLKFPTSISHWLEGTYKSPLPAKSPSGNNVTFHQQYIMSKTKTKKARRELKRDGARKIAAHQRKIAKASTTANNTQKPPKKKNRTTEQPAPMQASQKHAVPFGPYEHILLVGEGDFSFTRSLVIQHGCANVTATSYDSETHVREKYPEFETVHDELSKLSPPVPLHHSIDATKLSSYKHLRCTREDDEEEDDGQGQDGWDTICFMFPHTGGLSTDVNRQVRANQALLVSFFKSCLEASTPKQRLQILTSQYHKNHPSPLRARSHFLRMGGRIIVTLFEGEPYTLWNIRDLARHAGLKVVESWKFDWDQYPGYRHVRTLGTIEGGGAWRGEDRDARTYVFEKVPLVADSDEEKELEKQNGGKKIQQRTVAKRPRKHSDSEEE